MDDATLAQLPCLDIAASHSLSQNLVNVIDSEIGAEVLKVLLDEGERMTFHDRVR